MTELHEKVTIDRSNAVRGGEGNAGTGTDRAASGVDTGAVGRLVGKLAGGFVAAAATGFVVGVAVGVVAGWRATPSSPRWQVWR